LRFSKSREVFEAESMKRDELKNSTLLTKGKSFWKPDVSRVEKDGRSVMVKDVARMSFPFRWTLGLWLIRNEWKIYARLGDMRGIPGNPERIDRFAFAMGFVQGRPLERGEELPVSFFRDLEKVLREVHVKGVVHLDLRHKGNILVAETGEPYLIDFNSSFAFGDKGILRCFLFPILQRVDYGGFLKLKQRVSPSLMTPQELSYLKRFNWLRKLWIFN
jgi:hypothetical protein